MHSFKIVTFSMSYTPLFVYPSIPPSIPISVDVDRRSILNPKYYMNLAFQFLPLWNITRYSHLDPTLINGSYSVLRSDAKPLKESSSPKPLMLETPLFSSVFIPFLKFYSQILVGQVSSDFNSPYLRLSINL